MGWTDKYSRAVVVVTGGASGLGRGLCERLAALGATVVIADVDLPRAEALATELAAAGARVSATRVDVTDPTSVEPLVEATVRAHGRLDYFFNNAGIAAAGDYATLEPHILRRAVEINVLGAAYGTLYAYRAMRTQGSGRIVNIASMYALVPSPLSSPYVATKHALGGLTESLQIESAGTGVGFTLVCPGFIATNLFAAGSYAPGFDSKLAEAMIPFPMLEVGEAVERTLQAAAKGRALAVFPAYARVMWWLHRLSPGLFVRLSQWGLAAQRKKLAAGAS